VEERVAFPVEQHLDRPLTLAAAGFPQVTPAGSWPARYLRSCPGAILKRRGPP
jgi:hypothetical protein